MLFFCLRFPNFLTSDIFIREVTQLVDSSQGSFSPHAFVVSLIEELSEVLHWWCCKRGNCIFFRPSQFSACSLEHWLVLPSGRGSWRGHSKCVLWNAMFCTSRYLCSLPSHWNESIVCDWAKWPCCEVKSLSTAPLCFCSWLYPRIEP